MGIEVSGVAATTPQKVAIRAGINAVTHHGGVANQAAMVALSDAVVGDMCTRSDTGTVWILSTGTYETPANWTDTGADSSGVTFEEVSTTTYTPSAADFTSSKCKVFTHASGCLVTGAQGLTAQVGATMNWRQGVGAGQITFQGDGTATVASLDNMLVSGGEKSVGSLQWLGTNQYLLVGQLRVQETHMIPVTAAGMSPSASGGCAPLATVAGAAGQPDYMTLNFDATTAESAQFTIPMPESWDEGTITFQPIWSHPATTVDFGVCWKLQAVAISNDDPLAANFGTNQSSVDTGGTTDDVYVGPMSAAITVAGSPQAGDLAFFRVSRDPADAGDTMAVDARLHGIRLYFTANAVEDA